MREVMSRDGIVYILAIAAGIWAVLTPSIATYVLAIGLIAVCVWLLVSAAATPTKPSAPSDADVASSRQISAIDLAAAIPDPLVIFDDRATIFHANQAAQAAFGVLQEGMPLLLKFRTPELQDLINAVTSGQTGPFAVEYTERVPLEATYRVTGANIGKSDGLHFILFKDQSETRRIDRMRADFIANASHELRTPLASISGFVETLLGPAKDDPNARNRFLKIMQDQTGRMSRLIDDLLSLSRLEMRPHGRPTTSVDLRQIVQEVVDTLRPLTSELSVKVETVLGDFDATIHGDRDELFQVFVNLVENACKYGQSGERVLVSMGRIEKSPAGEIKVVVRDFGPGIAEEHIPRITERFYRADVASSRAQKGTGLGLSIVKHILTRHNGRLVIHSKVGEGAEFTVTIPAR